MSQMVVNVVLIGSDADNALVGTFRRQRKRSLGGCCLVEASVRPSPIESRSIPEHLSDI